MNMSVVIDSREQRPLTFPPKVQTITGTQGMEDTP